MRGCVGGEPLGEVLGVVVDVPILVVPVEVGSGDDGDRRPGAR